MRKTLIPVLTALTVLTVMAFQAMTPEPTVADAPRVVLPQLSGYRLEMLEASEEEIRNLPSDTRFVKGRYFSEETGDWHLVTAVIGGISKSSIHRPELCLPSQGFEMRDPRNERFAGGPWHLITLARRAAPPMGFAYTFYNQSGYRTCSHVRRIFRDVCDRSFLNRIDRWVMVTVNSSVAGGPRQSSFIESLERKLQ